MIVGIDVGTTAVKVVAFSPGSSGRRSAQRPLTLRSPEPGHQVQEPDQVMAAVAAALAEVVEACGAAEVIGLSVSTAMHGLIGLDADHRPITPVITWADTRASDEATELHRSGQADTLHRTSGTPVHPMSPLTNLLWFSRHDPATLHRARWWVGLKDLVLHWLTGEVCTDLSSASGTGLLDLASGGWSDVALELVGVDAQQLPPILPTTATLALAPRTAERAGLDPGIPVVVGAADGPLGNVGTGALAPGVASLSLGTSGAVRTVVERPETDEERGLFCYAITGDRWVIGGAISNGGSVARWAADTLAVADEAALLELAAQAPPGSDGLVMLPFLLPERAPLWDPDQRGALLGLRADHTPAHLARAAIEGVCLQVRALVDRVDAVTPVRSVRATGGVFRSPFWRSMVAAAVGRPLHVVDGVDGTARGAAALGLVALGRATDLVEAVGLLGVDAHAPPAAEAVDQEAAAVYAGLAAASRSALGQTPAHGRRPVT